MGEEDRKAMLQDKGRNNRIDVFEGVDVSGYVRGSGNQISIERTAKLQLNLTISGDNNVVRIGKGFRARDLSISIGNHVPAHEVSLTIGDHSSAEPDCRFFLYNSGNSLTIGKSCMLSNSIVIRTGESPHLIFDDTTGEYLDTAGNVVIGDHCWIGERAYLTKRTVLPNDTVVAACSVVTRAFSEEKTMVAGNPAVVKRRNIRWVRNSSQLPKDSSYEASHAAFNEKFEREKLS